MVLPKSLCDREQDKFFDPVNDGKVTVRSERPAGEYLTVRAAVVSPGTIIKSGAGILRTVTIARTGTGGASIQLYDGLSDGGALIADIDLSDQVATLIFDIDFDTGLTYTSAGSNFEVSVIYV